MEPLGKADSVVSEQSGQPSERDAEPSGSVTYWGAWQNAVQLRVMSRWLVRRVGPLYLFFGGGVPSYNYSIIYPKTLL